MRTSLVLFAVFMAPRVSAGVVAGEFPAPLIHTALPAVSAAPVSAAMCDAGIQSQAALLMRPALTDLAAAAPSAQPLTAAPVAVAVENRTAALSRNPVTRLYGVSPEQLGIIVYILKKHYGSNLLDLAAIGSRARGKASFLKRSRPAMTFSDLDLSPLLRNGTVSLAQSVVVEKEIEAAVGFPVQLHGVLSTGETRFGDTVPFYGGGYEAYEHFATGDAVRISLTEVGP